MTPENMGNTVSENLKISLPEEGKVYSLEDLKAMKNEAMENLEFYLQKVENIQNYKDLTAIEKKDIFNKFGEYLGYIKFEKSELERLEKKINEMKALYN